MSRDYPTTVKVLSSGDMWRVVEDGAFVSRHRKKDRAVEKGRKLARKGAGGELWIQAMDGRWQDKREY